jgi:tRNA threonylcarbamoyladenosine biosynthesis protein TsaB
MALLLHIDTATEHASVCISDNEKVLAIEESKEQKNHASFLQPAIQSICKKLDLELKNIDAVAVTQGPGSYTGLRVGLASAKGLCFALQKPLILVNTLEVMARAAMQENFNETYLYCPMIDARRMEVFTALYNAELNEIIPTSAIILNESSFEEQLKHNKIIFSGSGYVKFKNILSHPNAIFSSIQHSSLQMIPSALQKFNSQQFADIAYSEPFYGKEFYTPASKH